MIMWREFGWDVRSARERLGVAPAAVAKANKVALSTWYKAEAGRPIKLEPMLLICRWIGADPYRYLKRAGLARPGTVGAAKMSPRQNSQVAQQNQ